MPWDFRNKNELRRNWEILYEYFQNIALLQNKYRGQTQMCSKTEKYLYILIQK